VVFKKSDLLVETFGFPSSCLHSVRAEMKFPGSGTGDREGILQDFWRDLGNSTLTPGFN